MPLLHLNINFSEDEYIRAMRFFYLHVWRYGFWILLILPIWAAVLILAFVWDLLAFAYLVSSGGFVFFAVLFYQIFVSPKQFFRRNKKHFVPMAITFSGKEIHFKNPYMESRFAWSNEIEIYEAQSFYLFIHPGYCTPIPKRVFQHAQEELLFRELVKKEGIIIR